MHGPSRPCPDSCTKCSAILPIIVNMLWCQIADKNQYNEGKLVMGKYSKQLQFNLNLLPGTFCRGPSAKICVAEGRGTPGAGRRWQKVTLNPRTAIYIYIYVVFYFVKEAYCRDETDLNKHWICPRFAKVHHPGNPPCQQSPGE